MQLFGQRNYHTGLYHIEANLLFQNIKNIIPISFVVSIATQRSFISHGDALKLGINCEQLNLKQGVKMNGIPTRVINYCSISFMLPYTNTGITEYFTELDVQCPKILTIDDEQTYSSIPSILGLDFISRYKITFLDYYVILEK